MGGKTISEKRWLIAVRDGKMKGSRKEGRQSMKLNYKRTFLIGLAFLSISAF